MYYGNIIYCDTANGIGCRTSLFVSGCRHHCKGCFSPMTWNFSFGQPFTNDTKEKIIASLEPFYIRGLSILGGEPMEPENQETILNLITSIKQKYPDKTIWMYSGYTWEQLHGIDQTFPHLLPHTARIQEILNHIDILVDGEFIESEKDIRLNYRGSKNQRILDVPMSIQKQQAVITDKIL